MNASFPLGNRGGDGRKMVVKVLDSDTFMVEVRRSKCPERWKERRGPGFLLHRRRRIFGEVRFAYSCGNMGRRAKYGSAALPGYNLNTLAKHHARPGRD
jgi:hypothetical protein